MLHIQQNHVADAGLRSIYTALIKERAAFYGKLYVYLQYVQRTGTGVGEADDKHAKTLAPGRRSPTRATLHRPMLQFIFRLTAQNIGNLATRAFTASAPSTPNHAD